MKLCLPQNLIHFDEDFFLNVESLENRFALFVFEMKFYSVNAEISTLEETFSFTPPKFSVLNLPNNPTVA